MRFRFQFMMVAIFCALTFGFVLSGCSILHPKPQFESGEEVSVTATVVAIDYPSRMVTLKGPQGNLMDIFVGEDAYNFDQVKVGDLVDITYSRSVAVHLQKAGGEPSAVSGSGVTRAPKGQKPESTFSNVVEITARVENIDYDNRLVDIRGPYGNLIQVEVDDSVKNFKNIKKGDEVVVRYVEAVAISVRPAAQTESD